ncbi:Vab2p [Saccharomyces cerevisiae VL3]|nr:Vab2p [Saccharomyces cerevisiae Lalvin QA23]EGA87230.1 Vab2p [Saccharomyces cerevisiae VL3]
MVADLTKGILKWKSRIEFDAVGSSSYYEELKGLPPLASHKKLTQAAIFNSTKYELLQVKKDILSIYEVVSRDIDEERNQMQQIELQLKKSLKKVEHSYKNVLKQRASTNCINGNDRLLANAEKKIGSLNEELACVNDIVSDIVNNLTALNANLPKKAQLLKDDSINVAHYPLLFDFLHKSCPKSIIATSEASIHENASPSPLLEHDELPAESINSFYGENELQSDSLAPLQTHDDNISSCKKNTTPKIQHNKWPFN